MESTESSPASRARPAHTRVEVAARTHIGPRAVNADAFVTEEAAGFYAVADGMGDTARSCIIAQMALDAVRELFTGSWSRSSRAERSIEEARQRILRGVTNAHGVIYSPWVPRSRRRGTTFAGVVDCGDHVCVGHVGDSRVYLLRASRGRLALLTRDHTVAGEACGRGASPEEAAELPDARMLTRVIGVRTAIRVEPVVQRWEPGDIALLCTDGVSDHVAADAITDILLDAPDLGVAADQLIDRAGQLGSSDNATVVLVHRVT